MNMKKPPKGVALGIGMNYIRFAIEEPHLFRFLFQSDYFNGKTLLELIDAEELTPVLSAMQRSLGIGMEQTKTVFVTVFLFAHGYASIIANNSLKYDEDNSRRKSCVCPRASQRKIYHLADWRCRWKSILQGNIDGNFHLYFNHFAIT